MGLLPLIQVNLQTNCPPSFSPILGFVDRVVLERNAFIVQVLPSREVPPLDCDIFLKTITSVNVYQNSCIRHSSY